MPVEAQYIEGQLVLKYLFVAEYEDGTIYEQGSGDLSKWDGANAYTDIYYKPFKPLEELAKFSLVGEGHVYSVDLKDGHFEVDGVPFKACPDEKPLPDGGKYELVYWRGHRHDIMPEQNREIHYIHYRIGWKWSITNLEGEILKEVTQTISVE